MVLRFQYSIDNIVGFWIRVTVSNQIFPNLHNVSRLKILIIQDLISNCWNQLPHLLLSFHSTESNNRHHTLFAFRIHNTLGDVVLQQEICQFMAQLTQSRHVKEHVEHCPVICLILRDFPFQCFLNCLNDFVFKILGFLISEHGVLVEKTAEIY